MHEELVARLLSISSARLAIFDATAMGKMPGLARVVQDSRLRDYFNDQCVFVSCQWGPATPRLNVCQLPSASEISAELTAHKPPLF